MESLKKRLRVFEAITKSLSPETKPQKPSASTQFPFFTTEDPIKPPQAETVIDEHCQTPVSSKVFLGSDEIYKFSKVSISNKKNLEHISLAYHDSTAMENHSYAQLYDSPDCNLNDYKTPYSIQFMNLSTEESSKEEYEDRRKPKKRPVREGEKTFYVIKVSAIKKELDLRTTVMIKNIPNKYTQKMLLYTIDKKFAGTYNFLYLPIDFKNRCNVGYAFINFIDFKVIPAFYQEFNMKRWEKFNSEKICELAYGRIQGLEGLVDHFQNSSVLNQEDNKVKPVIISRN